VKTFVFSFKLQLVFPLLKEKQMAVLGGRTTKKKIESDNHLVAAFPTRGYKDRLQDLQSDQGFLLCPCKAFQQLGDGAKS